MSQGSPRDHSRTHFAGAGIRGCGNWIPKGLDGIQRRNKSNQDQILRTAVFNGNNVTPRIGNPAVGVAQIEAELTGAGGGDGGEVMEVTVANDEGLCQVFRDWIGNREKEDFMRSRQRLNEGGLKGVGSGGEGEDWGQSNLEVLFPVTEEICQKSGKIRRIVDCVLEWGQV
jgi:hypothetical protein